ncbi:phosphopantetheine-binding protein [Brevundimonas sp. M20]|uniref:phosphopantetheine-binding protein n=1 Tax=Brevundimonas sp. M20 TaxID=2591463 RepID=UPI00114712D4|nr:phosphopantetheine-binding protein [Brevundimonas sp. M20]QDH74010.1 acyl carrier protein [Brevundimonas sp. M20]
MTTPTEFEMKSAIIEVLNLEDITPDDIGADEDLFGNTGLALDSIDALEIGVALQKKFDIKIDVDDKQLHSHFQTINALIAFVAQQKALKQ